MLRRSCLSFNHRSSRFKARMSATDAVRDITSGSVLAIGGFGASGNPDALCGALAKRGRASVRNLSVYTNAGSIGTPTQPAYGFGKNVKAKQVSRVACSHFGYGSYAERFFLDGFQDKMDDHADHGLEIEFTPQGSLAERMRAGGAGIPAFWTNTSANTVLTQGGIAASYSPRHERVWKVAPPKETRIFPDYGLCVLEEAIHADFALIKAEYADKYGNLCFHGMSRNFGTAAATCAKTCIVEVKRIVDHIAPDDVHLPGVYVDRIVCDETTNYKTLVENVAISRHKPDRDAGSTHNKPPTKAALLNRVKQMNQRERMQRRAALELTPVSQGGYARFNPDIGLNVNLGIGLPTACVNYVDAKVMRDVFVHSENGLLGTGPSPTEEELDEEYIDAGKATVTAVPGAATFPSDVSFGMIRGGHLDMTILGGLQVSENGDLANFFIPGILAAGPGGAMDLAAGVKRVVITQTHTDKHGRPKLMHACTFPLTQPRCVSRVITDKAVFDFVDGRMVLMEIAPDSSLEEIKQLTDARYEVSDSVKEMEFSWVEH